MLVHTFTQASDNIVRLIMCQVSTTRCMERAIPASLFQSHHGRQGITSTHTSTPCLVINTASLFQSHNGGQVVNAPQVLPNVIDLKHLLWVGTQSYEYRSITIYAYAS